MIYLKFLLAIPYIPMAALKNAALSFGGSIAALYYSLYLGVFPWDCDGGVKTKRIDR